MRKRVDAGLIVAGIAIWGWAFVAGAHVPWWRQTSVVLLLGTSSLATVLVSMVSRRRGWTVVTAWDDVLLAPVGALLTMAPAVFVHLIGGLATMLVAPSQRGSQRLPSLGRDAIAAAVQVVVVTWIVRGHGSPVGVVLAVLAGLSARWVIEQLIVLVRAWTIAPRPGLARATLVEPISSYAPVGLALGALLAVAASSPALTAMAALLSLGLLWKFSAIQRQRDRHEQAAGVVALSERLQTDAVAEDAALVELEQVARSLWPNDDIRMESNRPRGRNQASTSIEVAGEVVWLVLERPAERAAPDSHDQRLLDALGATVNGVLARRQLLETMRAAQEIRAAVMAAVAHDIRAPLALLTGGVATLRRHGRHLNDDQRDSLLGPIERAGARMEALVDDLLDLERLSLSGPTDDLLRGHCRPRDVVERAADDLGLTARLKLEATSDLPEVAMPSRLLHRVVENLLANAAKHSPEGAPIVVSVSSDGTFLRMHVDDQGAGVPDHARATIFAAFEQLDDHAKAHGVGLGLYVVGRFVKACGGRVWVDEAPTGGASFRIELPAVSPTTSPVEYAVP